MIPLDFNEPQVIGRSSSNSALTPSKTFKPVVFSCSESKVDNKPVELKRVHHGKSPFKPLTPDTPNKKVKTMATYAPSMVSPQLLPLVPEKSQDMALRKREYQIDCQIKEELRRKDLIVKAIEYVNNHEEAKVLQLIDKWRDVAQKSSNYLLNDLQVKAQKMGGAAKLRQLLNSAFQDDDLLQEYQLFIESDSYHDLTALEKSELHNKMALLQPDDTDDEFGMKELYAMLKLDYSLVFGS